MLSLLLAVHFKFQGYFGEQRTFLACSVFLPNILYTHSDCLVQLFCKPDYASGIEQHGWCSWSVSPSCSDAVVVIFPTSSLASNF